LTDGLDASERREQLDQSILRETEYLDVEVFRRPAAQAIAHPAPDDQRAPSSVSGGERNTARHIER
jgi:hypothetical protein